MSSFARMSCMYAPTLKEVPAEAEVVSHQLLLRAGMMRRLASGLYSYLPLGRRSLKKIEEIIREEMEAIDCHEILMPALQPGEIWHESGRWDVYGPELMRLQDRHGRDFCLGPTHEEVIMTLVRDELRSYKQLPLSLFQIQTKYRDERRPRFGLLRSREFLMKDAYSFHASEESLDETYQKFYEAYARICRRLGLEFRPVEADSGQIGGSETVEFMALADAGEAEIIYGESYAANTEVARVRAVVVEHEPGACEEVYTPGVSSMEELAAMLNIDLRSTVKALAFVDAAAQPYVLFVPGDHELNELKAQRIMGEGYSMMNDVDLKRYGLVAGNIGPRDLPEDIRLYADRSLQALRHWVCGANKKDYHLVGLALDDIVDQLEFVDLILAQAGDLHEETGEILNCARGIEVSQIFKLGTKYSDALQASFMDESGKEQPFIMGCYGVGVSRCLAAVIEQHNDEHGMCWPVSVAPYELVILPLALDDELLMSAAFNLAARLSAQGIELIVDDRAERPGVKFADADLLGYPYQLICGKRSFLEGMVELKHRASGERTYLALDTVVEYLSERIQEDRCILLS